MPSLSSMRALDPAGDAMQPLGPPIREDVPTQEPAPAPTGTPGIVRLPDGKLATDLPDPTKAKTFGFAAPDCRKMEERFLAWTQEIQRTSGWFQQEYLQRPVPELSGTTTGRISSSTPHFVEVERAPKIRGRVHDSIVFDALACEKVPKAAPTEWRKPRVGDFLVVLSGQLDHDKINSMVGQTWQVESVQDADATVKLNGWYFNAPGCGVSGTLQTMFADGALS